MLNKLLLYKKFVCKMLMKLATAINFINVKHVNFSYELCFSIYILALAKNSYKKFVRKMLMKFTTGWPRYSR
jgi:hypothetical protein